MGFLDKVKGAAQTAKDGIERSGVVDKAKDAVNTKLHPEEAPPPEPSDEQIAREWEWIASVLARGGMDPRPLLTVIEVESTLGVSGLRLSLGGSDDEISADHMDAKRAVGIELMCFHSFDEAEPFVPSDAYDTTVDLALSGETTTAVDGVGDRAVVGDRMCFFQRGDKVFAVSVRGVDDGTAPTKAVALARLAASRL